MFVGTARVIFDRPYQAGCKGRQWWQAPRGRLSTQRRWSLIGSMPGAARELDRVAFDSPEHKEDFIQTLIYYSPTLLPVREIEPAFGIGVARRSSRVN